MGCDPLRQTYRTKYANLTIDDFSVLSDNTLFLAVGRPLSWENENSPPPSTDSVEDKVAFMQSIVAAHRLTKTDVSLVLRRVDWSRGIVYDAYRSNVDLYDDRIPQNFYALVDERRVYKCIDNNGGAQSTIAPTHTDSQIRQLSDGYRWKFMYSLQDSQRKFLTSQYMPVEFVETLRTNDERNLQWAVQQAAITGSIDYIDVVESGDAFAFAVSQNENNVVTVDAPAGATSVTINSAQISSANELIGYAFKVDAGPGVGQQRIISDCNFIASGISGNTVVCTLDQPTDFGLSANDSKFSIVPQVKITGDGRENDNTFNSNLTIAEATAKINSSKILTSIEMIDTGKEYSFADVEVFPTDPQRTGSSSRAVARAVISPNGGNGSNPVEELGAAGIMIAVDFDRSEGGAIPDVNEIRQIGLIENPNLNNQQARLYINEPISSSTFPVGSITGDGSGATGTVVSFVESDTTGQSQVVVNTIQGTFASGMTFGESTIRQVEPIVRAGKEQSNRLDIRVVPVGGIGSLSTTNQDKLTAGSYIVGRGSTAQNIPDSRASGRISSFVADDGTNTIGSLFVESPNGAFSRGEHLWRYDYDYAGGTGPIVQVSYLDESLPTDAKTIYTQTSTVQIAAASGVTFSPARFAQDSILFGHSGGATSSIAVVIGGGTSSSTTADTTVIFDQGQFRIDDVVLDATGATLGTVSNIIKSPDLEYNTGNVLYIQNIQPVARSNESREEIKFVLSF